MTSDPSSGPGAGLVGSKQTVLSSAQLKALFTTPIAVSPAPRSDQIVLPLLWSAVATDSSVPYANPGGGALSVGYHPRGEQVPLQGLLSALALGDPSLLAGDTPIVVPGQLSDAPGSVLEISMDTGNLTSGTFPLTFTLFYVFIGAT